MTEAFLFIAAPIVMGGLMVLIHSYLGLHVLERNVIFVDISLSQVAVLGALLSTFLLPELEKGSVHLALSLSFCLIVSLLFTLLRRREKAISQEAIIGLTYAFASGALVLISEKMPHGIEQLKHSLVGNILYVSWQQVFETAVVYFVVGIIHWVYRKNFWGASKDEASHYSWDLLFYFLFSVVITFSTQHAGVLVVFALLVAPAATAVRWTKSRSKQLFLSWGIGFLGIIIGFAASYHWDWPAGPTLVCVLCSGFFIGLLVQPKQTLTNLHS